LEKGSLAERSIVALRVVTEVIRHFGSCTNVPMTKDLLQSVKRAHVEYALFLENERKRQCYLNKEKGRRRNKLKKRNELIKEKAKSALLEQLKNRKSYRRVSCRDKIGPTARELISEASRKLTEALQGSGKDLQSAKVAQVMLRVTAGNEVDCSS